MSAMTFIRTLWRPPRPPRSVGGQRGVRAGLLDQRLQLPVVLGPAGEGEVRQDRLPAEGELPVDLHLVPLDLDDVVARLGVAAKPERRARPGVDDVDRDR